MQREEKGLILYTFFCTLVLERVNHFDVISSAEKIVETHPANCESVELFLNGQSLGEKDISTSGSPAKIQLLADRESITADGQDVIHIEISILGAKNHFALTPQLLI
jgi:hypothetical protein